MHFNKFVISLTHFSSNEFISLKDEQIIFSHNNTVNVSDQFKPLDLVVNVMQQVRWKAPQITGESDFAVQQKIV